MTIDNAVSAVCPSAVEVVSSSFPSLASVNFSIPPQDEEFFASQLTFPVQREVRRLLNLCRVIHQFRNPSIHSSITAACKRLAAEHASLGRGYSASSLRTKYYTYLRTGDWRSMWNKAKAPPVTERQLPPKFVEWVKAMAENNQRKIAPAINEIYHVYRTGFDLNGKEYHAIPGYDARPDPDEFTGLPSGWSYANLQRKVTDLFQLTASRIGRSAARTHALKVFTSRVGVAIGEYVLFDDHEFNLKINFPGQRRAMRPKGFCAMDLLTACCNLQSFKPTLWDQAEEKKQALTERDFMWFVVNYLLTHGHRTDERGTALIVEWGTAAIRDWFEQRIHDATRGLVRVERSGKFGAPAHIGQAEGRTHGNFRFKALLESFFNPLDNLLASLPGQVGKDRNHSPEQLHGLERENDKLLAAAHALTLSRSDAPDAPRSDAPTLHFPFLNWPQFLDRVLNIFKLLNNRTDHKLQGWEKLGFIAQEWRLPSAAPSERCGPHANGWLPENALNELSPEARSVALALINSDPTLRRARKLSPQEAWDTCLRGGPHASGRSAELRPLPLFKLPELLGPEFSRELTVKAGIFEFDDRDIDSDPIRFKAVDRKHGNLSGKFQCYINPFGPAPLVACDSNNRVVGICQRIVPSARNDIDGVKRQMGEARAWEAEALAELNARHLDTARENVARRAHNARVLSGGASVPASRGPLAPDPALAHAPAETIDLRTPPQNGDRASALRASGTDASMDDTRDRGMDAPSFAPSPSLNSQPSTLNSPEPETIDLR